MDKYVGLYVMEEVISENIVKLKLPVSIIIHLVVNVSKVVRYRKLMKRQRVEEPKLVKVDRVEEQEMENVLNKRKVKRFMAENNIQKKKEDLENTKEVVTEFERKMSIEVRKQENLNLAEEQDYRRGKLPGKYMAKMLYEQNNRKFKKEYLKKNI